MNDKVARVKTVFLEAVERYAPEKWPTYLDEACGDDVDLRHQVEVLLDAHVSGISLLDKGAIAMESTSDQHSHERAGMVIGPYKLLQKIGEGGMGSVYLAEQHQPVQRKVALKVIKPGMDSQQVIARFDAERQALSLMDHPNISKVLDAGTTDLGRPYFVMELVKGRPITQYCDENQFSPRQRLELFMDACHAIQHAHQKGIIHRDIKPSNVMVADFDEKPVVKVIDFGVAKALYQPLTEKSVFTSFGQLLGTPVYMSPEQAKFNQLDIDTRSDIYSLGVLLYELLTGATPFDRDRLRLAAWDEMLRIIREEEPPRPSTKLSASASLASVSANRQTEREKLAKLVHGELDWIVMKALEKDRSRRYATASGLGMDVKRFLADEPVHACPPSRWYRWSKVFRRNKIAILTTCVVALVLLVLSSIAVSQRIMALQNEARAIISEAETKIAKIEASSQYHLAAFGELKGAKLRLQSTLHGKTKRVLDRDLPKVIGLRNRLSDKATLAEIDEGIRSLWLAAQATYDLEESPFVQLPSLPKGNWPAVLHPHRHAAVVGGRTRPFLAKPGDARLEIPGSEAAAVSRIWFSPSGRHLALAMADGGISIWDEYAAKRLAVWSPSEPPKVLDLAFDDDGSAIDVVLADGKVERIGLQDLKPETVATHACSLENKPVTAAFSGPKKLLALADQRGNIVVCRGEQVVSRFLLAKQQITSLTWSRNENLLAAATTSKVFIVSVEKQLLVSTLTVPNAAKAQRLVFTSDDRLFCAAQSIWDISTGELILGSPQEVADVSSNGQMLMATEERITFAKLKSPSVVHECVGHEERVLQCAWSGDSTRFATIDDAFVLCVWEPRNGRLMHRVELTPGSLFADNGGVALNRDGTIACAMYRHQDEASRAYLLDTLSGKLSEPIELPASGFFRVAFHEPTGEFVGVCEKRPGDPQARTTALRLSTTGNVLGVSEIQRIQEGEEGFFDQFLSSNGEFYVWVGPEKPPSAWRAEVWNVKSGQRVKNIPLSQFGQTSLAPSVVVSPDCRHLWVHSDAGSNHVVVFEVNQDSRKWPNVRASARGDRWLVTFPSAKEERERVPRILSLQEFASPTPWISLRHSAEVGAPHSGATAFSPNAHWLTLSGGDGGRLSVIDLKALENGATRLLPP